MGQGFAGLSWDGFMEEKQQIFGKQGGLDFRFFAAFPLLNPTNSTQDGVGFTQLWYLVLWTIWGPLSLLLLPYEAKNRAEM